MKRLLFFAVAMIALWSCSKDFELNATLNSNNYDGMYVYIIKRDPVLNDDSKVLDSVRIENGKYFYSQKIEGEPFVMSIALSRKYRAEDYSYKLLLPQVSCIAEPGRVLVEYLHDGIKVSGTKMNDEYDDLVLGPERIAHTKCIRYSELGRRADAMADREHGMDLYNDSIRITYAAIRPSYQEFARRHINSDVGATIFFGRRRDFYPDSLYEALNSKVKPEYAAKNEKKLERISRDREAMNMARASTRSGQPYHEFTSALTNGTPVNFSSVFNGSNKAVLLDFWASWCRPCRDEIPTLKKLYSKYHNGGLEIVSVSLDTKRTSWERALEQEKMPWPQWGTLEGFESQGAKAYAVQAIPFVIVFSGKGTIVLVNRYGPELEQAIKDLGCATIQ